MAHIFPSTYTRPIPPSAKPCTVRGKPGVKWQARGGREIVGEILTDRPGYCRVQSPTWWVGWIDANGQRQKERVGPKRAAERRKLEIEATVEAQRAGLPVPATGTTRTLTELVIDYRAHLDHRGRSGKHARTTEAMLAAMVAGCGWTRPGDASVAALDRWLAARRADPDDAIGLETCNHYLRAARAFFRWLERNGRITYNPLAHLPLHNADTDRRHPRRALSPEEFDKLIRAAVASPYVWGRSRGRRGPEMDGPARAMLYLCAAYTGLRANELRSLTPAAFTFATTPPAVVIEAGSAKNRKRFLIPLQADVAARLEAWARGRGDGPLWPGRWVENAKGAGIIRRDLAAAGIPYRTERGVCDLHALRKLFGTMLARAGVPLQHAQKLMRHSDPRLTANVYTDLTAEELAAEVNKLPPPG